MISATFEKFPPKSRCKNWIFAGGKEPWAWIGQSFRYARRLRQHGRGPEAHFIRGYHHFNIMDQYLEPDSPIARTITGRNQIGIGGSPVGIGIDIRCLKE